MTRVFLHMVVRDEADRYLRCCLDWHCSILTAVHVYDDGSTDDTAEVARSYGATVSVRGDDITPFLVHEGRLRDAAWRAFEEAMKPVEGDYVLALDADEFLVSSRDEVDGLFGACEAAEEAGASGVRVSIPEVFAVDEHDGLLTRPQVRVDGHWARIDGVRLFRYQPGGHFRDRVMGCGSAPTYVEEGSVISVDDPWLLHYGYAQSADRVAKHARYSLLTGHSQSHVESIVTEPVLRLWTGPSFPIWRGSR